MSRTFKMKLPHFTVPRISRALTLSLVASVIFAAATVLLTAAYFKSDHRADLVNKRIALLQADLDSTRNEMSKTSERAADLENLLQTARTRAELESLTSKAALQALAAETARSAAALAALKRKAQARKQGTPSVPVKVRFRVPPEGKGRGMVGEFVNPSSHYLPLIVSLRNPTTADAKSFSFPIAPRASVRLGHRDGWEFVSGDRVALTSNGYKTVEIRVP
jgi:hypothetical protein